MDVATSLCWGEDWTMLAKRDQQVRCENLGRIRLTTNTSFKGIIQLPFLVLPPVDDIGLLDWNR